MDNPKLELFLVCAPGALFIALSFFSGLLPQQDQQIDLLCRKWLGEGAPAGRALPLSAVFDDVCNILEMGTYGNVLQLTDFVQYHPLVWRARMGAGDIDAAIKFFNVKELFYPHFCEPDLDSVVRS